MDCKIHAAEMDGRVRRDLAPLGRGGELCLGLRELVIGVAQKDQAKDGDGVLVRLQLGIRAELVCRLPQALFCLGGVGGMGFSGRLAPTPVL